VRPDHMDVFKRVARETSCMIGLREPNRLLDRWVGRPGFIAKPASCGAKAADAPDHPLGGLVVDPTVVPEAFRATSARRAAEKWVRFAKGGQLPTGFTRATVAGQAGLILLHGSAIHSDYDLMMIVKVDAAGRLVGETKPRLPGPTAIGEDVVARLNGHFGRTLVCHGPEFEYEKVGADESEGVLLFRPDGSVQRTQSHTIKPTPAGNKAH
jgi:hypothetical protein